MRRQHTAVAMQQRNRGVAHLAIGRPPRHLQMTGRAGQRQIRDASIALLHGDGGVLSSHVSMFLERVR